MPGLVQNWPAPRVNDACRPAAILASPLAQGSGKNENRVGAAHLGIKRDRLRTRGGDVHQDSARLARSREPASLDSRMLHQGAADLVSSAEKK